MGVADSDADTRLRPLQHVDPAQPTEGDSDAVDLGVDADVDSDDSDADVDSDASDNSDASDAVG